MRLKRFTFHPSTQKRLAHFRQNPRAYYSFVVLFLAFFFTLFAELLCNNRPIVMKYDGQWYFPLFKHYPAATFGETVRTEVNFKALTEADDFRAKGNWAYYPLIPHHPNASMENLADPPPTRPTLQNWLGTDDRGRDLLARLIYGFRNSMVFALICWAFTIVLAFLIGASMGYLGGKFDLVGQRLIEIWNALPVLYLILFLLSLFPPTLFLLAVIWVTFSWIGLSGYVRAEVLKIRKQEFVSASKILGGGPGWILRRHILPNSLTPLLTFSPFLLSAAIGSLAALDYLGLGLPPPTASWGELLRQGKENLTSWWLALYPFLSLFLTLLLLGFIGEGVRDAFDPRASGRR